MGIHHLHLSLEKEPNDKFYKRSDNLVFVRFFEDIVYFIDIMHHNAKNKYSNSNLLRIVRQNWPSTLEPVYKNGLTPVLNDEEYFTIRKKGYTTGVNVDGEGFIGLNVGYAVNGFSMKAGMLADNIIRWGYANRELHKTNKHLFIKRLREQLWMPTN